MIDRLAGSRNGNLLGFLGAWLIWKSSKCRVCCRRIDSQRGATIRCRTSSNRSSTSSSLASLVLQELDDARECPLTALLEALNMLVATATEGTEVMMTDEVLEPGVTVTVATGK